MPGIVGTEEIGEVKRDERVIRDGFGGDFNRKVMQEQTALPVISEARIGQAVSVFPVNYWNLSCWTCRLEGD